MSLTEVILSSIVLLALGLRLLQDGLRFVRENGIQLNRVAVHFIPAGVLGILTAILLWLSYLGLMD